MSYFEAGAFAGSGFGSSTNGPVQGTIFVPTGLLGSQQATRWVGSTTSGSPSSGTFATGDFVIDQSGAIWICISGGTPGTWQRGGHNGVVTSAAATGTVAIGNTPTLVTSITGLSSTTTYLIGGVAEFFNTAVSGQTTIAAGLSSTAPPSITNIVASEQPIFAANDASMSWCWPTTGITALYLNAEAGTSSGVETVFNSSIVNNGVFAIGLN